ncbi:hypothetical protein HPP92_008150 [Vanilla planifolia]|uniref:ZF-HD dimerization-type domain-containing protein n=1 Tax=Vanilla planifolia TaxID=51239 RepID=A0A835V6Z1_VANPL|nr:hypothetical protein HPP92_008150 [Vanilla planifolia]
MQGLHVTGFAREATSGIIKRMEFRRQREDDDDEEGAVGYNSPPIRESAFSRPLLPTSSSLLPAKGGSTSGIGGARNGMVSPAAGTDPGSGGARNASPDLSSGSAGEPPPLRYRECLRNHAASIGGHVLDGCGEFMPNSTDTMKCAACGCHRSFHRREGESDHLSYSFHHHNGSNHSGRKIPLFLPPPPHPSAPLQKSIHSPALLAFGNNSAGTATDSSSEDLGRPGAVGLLRHLGSSSSSLKKRFRTKFTAEQKEKMMEFAERIGWRIQRQEELDLERFCADIGVSRQVFKVWMHNNKHSIRKQQQQPPLQQHEGL